MPTAKMVADSTQSDAALERRKRKRDCQGYRKKHKKDHRSRHSRQTPVCSNSSESKRRDSSPEKVSSHNKEDDFADSDLDLSKSLQPISFYIKDRTEMLEQMFHCIRGSSLKRALPAVLEKLPMQELKQLCLAQLEVMSKKRILRILAGDDPDNISSSGTDDSGDEADNAVAN